jgi:hypothetical protein
MVVPSDVSRELFGLGDPLIMGTFQLSFKPLDPFLKEEGGQIGDRATFTLTTFNELCIEPV